MSQFTANTLMPLFTALPDEQQHAFVEMANKLLTKVEKPELKKKKKSVYDGVCEVLGEKFRPGNEEMLIAEIMNEL